jgi:hypothetical protein
LVLPKIRGFWKTIEKERARQLDVDQSIFTWLGYRRADPAFLDARYKQTLGASPPHDVPFAVYRRIARPHTFGAHAVSCIGKLSRNLFHQDCMIPPGAVALDEVSGTIKGMGLSGVVTDTCSYVRMERANRCGPRRQQRMPHGQL